MYTAIYTYIHTDAIAIVVCLRELDLLVPTPPTTVFIMRSIPAQHSWHVVVYYHIHSSPSLHSHLYFAHAWRSIVEASATYSFQWPNSTIYTI